MLVFVVLFTWAAPMLPPLEPARPLATLSPVAAHHLAHQSVLWHVRLDSASSLVDGQDVFEVEGPQGEHATLWTPPGWIDQTKDWHHVEAVLTVIRHRPAVVDGKQLPGFAEYRLRVRK